MQPGWVKRAVVWLVMAESVRANWRAYPMLPTAWLSHGIGNSLALWLPELVATVDRVAGLPDRCRDNTLERSLYRTLCQICRDNPRWFTYISPAALGYILSHPRFNIYKGRMGELRLLGFGLDAIPHSMTAFALSLLVQDAVRTLAEEFPPHVPHAGLVRRLGDRPAYVSGAILALLTLIWEGGEYLMKQEELRRTGGDHTAINMQWSVEDSLFDSLSNALGWLAAARREHLQRHEDAQLAYSVTSDYNRGKSI